MKHEAHTHFCPRCQRRVDCPTGTTGCLFDARDDMTCDECAERATVPAR